MRWNCMSKVLRVLQITAELQDCPFFTLFPTVKTLSLNISITLLQISLKPQEHRGGYWRKKPPWTILEEQFPVPRNTAASKIGNSVIPLLWQLRCHCNSDYIKFSSLSNTTVVAIFPNLCLWRHTLCSNLWGINPEKLYRATLTLPGINRFDCERKNEMDSACSRQKSHLANNIFKTIFHSKDFALKHVLKRGLGQLGNGLLPCNLSGSVRFRSEFSSCSS